MAVFPRGDRITVRFDRRIIDIVGDVLRPFRQLD